MIAAVIAIILVGGMLAGPIMSNVEQPSYEVIAAQGPIEIRRYDPLIIAEVKVKGAREESISEGFRLLADYIFGNNTVQQNIAMTAPVQQQANEKIAMTAPVQQQYSQDMWKVSFVMPSEYTMEALPKPNDSRVTLIKIPAKKYAVITFSGTNSNENIAAHETQLMAHISKTQIQPLGTPQYAFYNPPWTLPFMRRNEVMIEIK